MVPAITSRDRLSALESLPLREEPETDEEREILDAAQAALLDDVRGATTDDVLAEIDAMRDGAATE